MAERLHTIVLVNRVPYPLVDGWRVRTFHMIRAVAGLGPVTLISFGGPADELAAGDLVQGLGTNVTVRLVPPVWRYSPWRLAQGLLGPTPFYVVAERSRRFRRALGDAVAARAPDILLCETVSMFDQLRGLGTQALAVIDTHNIDSLVLERYARSMRQGHRRFYAALTARKLARFEQAAFRAADAVVVCSEVERELLAGALPSLVPWVVPNGADVEQFEPRRLTDRAANRMLFFGRLDYHPNRDAIDHFVADILPLVRSERPDAEFHVAGAGGSAELAARLAATPGVVYHGRVDDLPGLIATAAVVVVPLRSGGGTRLKILEALAMESAVVSSTVGAEGIGLADGTEVLLADDARAFAAAVTRLLARPDEAAALGRAGRTVVREKFDWHAIEEGFRSRLVMLRHARQNIA